MKDSKATVRTCVFIGAPPPESINALTESIVSVLKVGYETRMDQQTIQEALSILKQGTEAPKDISITNCNFQMK